MPQPRAEQQAPSPIPFVVLQLPGTNLTNVQQEGYLVTFAAESRRQCRYERSQATQKCSHFRRAITALQNKVHNAANMPGQNRTVKGDWLTISRSIILNRTNQRTLPEI
jgi:hypothetical protein